MYRRFARSEVERRNPDVVRGRREILTEKRVGAADAPAGSRTPSTNGFANDPRSVSPLSSVARGRRLREARLKIAAMMNGTV